MAGGRGRPSWVELPGSARDEQLACERARDERTDVSESAGEARGRLQCGAVRRSTRIAPESDRRERAVARPDRSEAEGGRAIFVSEANESSEHERSECSGVLIDLLPSD